MRTEIPRDFAALDDATLRERIAAAIREGGGYVGGARTLDIHPLTLSHFVCRRGIDFLSVLRADEREAGE